MVQRISERRDELEWRRSSSAKYSANSFYKLMQGGGKVTWKHNLIWNCRVPPNVKVFAFLLMRNKLLTHEVMLRRGFQCEPHCQTCGRCGIESAMHLFFRCSYAREAWSRIADEVGFEIMSQGASLSKTWEVSALEARRKGGFKELQWATFFISACWQIWKSRNGKNFRGEQVPIRILVSRIIEESRLWQIYC